MNRGMRVLQTLALPLGYVTVSAKIIIHRRSLSRVKCPLKRDFFHCFLCYFTVVFAVASEKMQKEIEQMLQCAKGCDIIEPEEQRTRRTYKKRTCADTGRMKGAWLWRR